MGTPVWLEEALVDAGAGERLSSQLRFLLELDKAKSVYRRTYLTDETRLEDDAGHMWHAAFAALLLAEHSALPVDRVRLAMMLLVHDVVEIDAGDTFIYDDAAMATKADRELAAAERLFDLLPPDQRSELRSLWDEFEAEETATAKMAAAIDRLLPLLMNRAAAGRSWREHDVAAEKVFERNSRMERGSPKLWSVGQAVLEAAVAEGVLS